MKIMSTYKVKIRQSYGAFRETVKKYRMAVDFFIDVVLKEWEYISQINSQFNRLRAVEMLTHRTPTNLRPQYIFEHDFYKFPSYLRRAAITEALGKVSSYKSNYDNWETEKKVWNPDGLKREEYTLQCIEIIVLSAQEHLPPE